MMQNLELPLIMIWLNSNIGCFEILHMSPPLLRLCELNSNIGCFEIYCRQFVAVDIIG